MKKLRKAMHKFQVSLKKQHIHTCYQIDINRIEVD